MCLRNLFRRRIRTSLCVLGIAIGVMPIIAVGATTSRYFSIIKEMNLLYSGDIIVIARGSIFVQAVPIGGSLQENTVDKVKYVEGVKAAVPMLCVIGLSTYKYSLAQLVPLNVTVGMPLGNWSFLVGTTPLRPGGSWPSTDSSQEEVVIGTYLAQRYSLIVNSTIRTKNHELRVAGILDTPSAMLTRTIIMPLEVAQEIHGYSMLINMIVVEPQEGITEKELVDRIEEEIGGVKALTDDERNEIIEPILRDVEAWNLGIRSVLFSISMLIVMIVATTNVSERKIEFATLDAIGAPKSCILRMVIIETGLIGLFGCVGGILLGVVAAVLMISFYASVPVSFVLPDLFVIVTPTMMLGTLLSVVVLSCIAGVIPAMVAARVSKTEALR
jgi:putative ABC transport system permease protein